MGKVYRSDSDQTHTPMFHQVEVLMVDKNVNMGNLKWTLETFLKEFFEIDNISSRFRPSFFPFTEPSAELDIGYERKDGRIKIGSDKNFLEILGSGMVHPKVLENVGIDSKEYQGFAFGVGIERLAMLKYGINDLRMFFEGDIRFLKHYG
jgi:phenylalanyl-tRNA synthetase alpha chain